MRTTLNLDDELVRLAKQRALDQGTTLTGVIESALRSLLEEQHAPSKPYKFEWPSAKLGGNIDVDQIIAEQDAERDRRLYP